jgi:hypothetical protein
MALTGSTAEMGRTQVIFSSMVKFDIQSGWSSNGKCFPISVQKKLHLQSSYFCHFKFWHNIRNHFLARFTLFFQHKNNGTSSFAPS